MRSPVSSISIACLFVTLRESATIGVEQKRPISTPGVAKRASLDATARSQLATSWQPAALATPPTAAITGFGRCTIDIIIAAQLLNICSKKARPRSLSARRAVICFMSWPAQKPGPFAAMTSARTFLSSRTRRISADRTSIISCESEFRAAGRFSTSMAIAP